MRGPNSGYATTSLRPLPLSDVLGILLFVLLACAIFPIATAQVVQNVTLQNTDDDLIYVPELCVDGEACLGGWMVVGLAGSSNGSVTTTNGPDASFGNILPQVYLTFRGSALYVKTSDVSNATANLTVSSLPSGTLESRVFEPSRDFWAFEDLDESQLTTVAVTYLPDQDGEGPSRLDIDFVKISVSDASVTSSFLPSPTLPTSAFTPRFAPPSTLSAPPPTITSSSLRRQPTGAIVGETIAGFVVALLVITLIVVFVWRRDRRKRAEQERKETNALNAAQQILPVASRSRRMQQLTPLRV